METSHSGKCQCGAVRYKIIGEPITAHACHCKDCQKRSGSAFGLSLVFRTDAFTFTGELESYRRIADSGFRLTQYFCPKCGNTIFSENERRENAIVLHPGTLDDTKWFKLNRLIWTSRAQSWCPLPEGFEMFKESQPFE
ncbi:MAG: hypothetical protein CMM58_02715 [Rhodospirillaceae bacterium]|nr:hypothetical protein [Rhodospirillaceae bacterium]